MTAIAESHNETHIASSDIHAKQIQAWELFFSSGRVESDSIRQEIVKSWKRSIAFGLRPDSRKANVKITRQSIAIIKEKNSALIEAAVPIMESLKLSLKNTGFIFTLADNNGIVLAVIGDQDAVEFAKKNNYVEGCCRTEREVGTNSIGLCLATKMPAQVSGAEHFNARHHSWTCSSAPVTSPSGLLIGVITLSGESHSTHKHTLGMVISTACAIADALKRKHSTNEKKKSEQLMYSILRCISEAIMMVDRNGNITHANAKALHLVGMDINTLRDQSVAKLFPKNREILETAKTGESLPLVEVPIEKNRKRNFLMLKSYAVKGESGHCGSLLFLSEKKAFLNGVRKASGLKAGYTFDDIVGISDSLSTQVDLAKVAATSDARVLITGETGTGKELFAHAIHNASERKNGPFVAINCAAIPRDLIESEIMGYASGAYTGARQGGQTGKLELADGGTVFLDEISQMPLDVQAKFLRVLQDGTITRLGDTKPIKLDIRVIAATNENLYEKGNDHSFRHDLYFRLSVVEINVPALRNRHGDIEKLSSVLLERISKKSGRERVHISPEVMSHFKKYPWPGNIRELENVLEMAELTSPAGVIQVTNLPERIRQYVPVDVNALAFVGTATQEQKKSELLPPGLSVESGEEIYKRHSLSIKDAELNCLRRAMVETNGNIAEISRILGLSRSTIYRRIKEFNLNKVIKYN